MLTERDVRALLTTDAPVERMVLGEGFDVWAVGSDLVAKFPRTEIDAAKVPVEEALHPTVRGLLVDVVPAIRMVRPMGDGTRRFVAHARATGRQGQTSDGVTITGGEDLAADIGALFGSLHQIGMREAHDLGARDANDLV